MKNNKYTIIELILIFIVTLVFTLIFKQMDMDEIWNYGFAYNISTGLIPYKDFNMVITPLYPLCIAFLMIIFGKNIVIFHIINAIICTFIFYYLKKYTKNIYYLIYLVLLPLTLPNYNIACLLLLYVLITLEKENKNDYLIGLFLGITFLTKQSIGIYLFIPSLFTKDIKKILKRIIGFIIPNIIILIYLIYNKALYDFINYTFLGMKSFAKENYTLSINPITLLIPIIICTLIYKYLKTKDNMILYLLCFFGMSYPIFDTYHTIIPLLPAIAYSIKDISLNKKLFMITFYLFIVILFITQTITFKNKNYIYPNTTNLLKYRMLDNNTVSGINTLSNYYKNNPGRTFIIELDAYLIKLNTNTKIDKYDLLNDGNLGKGGIKQIIKEFDKICSKDKCTFLIYKETLNSNRHTQYNEEIYHYVMNNYQESGKILSLTIYKNH